MRSRVLAHRWHTTIAAAVLIAIVGWTTRSTLIHVPFVSDAIPVRLLVIVCAVLVALTPLYSSFPELEAALPREPLLRATRALAGIALALVAVMPAWAPTGQPLAGTELRLLLVLLTLSLVSLLLIGDLAWLVGLALGFTAIVVDVPPHLPVTTALEHVPLALLAITLAAAATAVTRYGPRNNS